MLWFKFVLNFRICDNIKNYQLFWNGFLRKTFNSYLLCHWSIFSSVRNSLDGIKKSLKIPVIRESLWLFFQGLWRLSEDVSGFKSALLEGTLKRVAERNLWLKEFHRSKEVILEYGNNELFRNAENQQSTHKSQNLISLASKNTYIVPPKLIRIFYEFSHKWPQVFVRPKKY
jgi:hypothetical protein